MSSPITQEPPHTNGTIPTPSSPEVDLPPSSNEAGPSKSPESPRHVALPLSPEVLSPSKIPLVTRGLDSMMDDGSPRSSMDNNERMSRLEVELETTRQEKDALGAQYRSLLGKLTAMRQSLGEKLREDAEELDRREAAINVLQTDNSDLQQTISKIQSELVNANSESASLQAQIAQLRSQSDSSSSDVLSLTREMRELRGEMERLRVEREEWQGEAGKERERRETMEEESRVLERRERDGRREWERGKEDMIQEKRRADNLQEVLSEFQSAKESELRQATAELDSQLRLAAASLSEYKLRAANAEARIGELGNDSTRSKGLEKELKDKNAIIGKLRHDAVVNNEHLTEALRRLRKTSSDTNVDRRLVTNILLSFLAASRGDTKRFEMLSILATILSWTDEEREKAGLQRMNAAPGAPHRRTSNTNKGKGRSEGERSAEEEAAMNESFSNLFVEFLLKEASQGEKRSPRDPLTPTVNTSKDYFASSASSVSSPPPLSPPGTIGTTSPPYLSRMDSSGSLTSAPMSIIGGLSNQSTNSGQTSYTTSTNSTSTIGSTAPGPLGPGRLPAPYGKNHGPY